MGGVWRSEVSLRCLLTGDRKRWGWSVSSIGFGFHRISIPVRYPLASIRMVDRNGGAMNSSLWKLLLALWLYVCEYGK